MLVLSQTLERETGLVSRFVALLTQEQEALTAAKPESLPAIHEEKTSLIGQLNTLESQRNQLIGGTPTLSEKERMALWLSAHPAETKIAGQWATLIGLALDAKRLNELNARLVKLHLDRTTQALAILTRRSEENTFYGANGQASQFTGSRIVDSA